MRKADWLIGALIALIVLIGISFFMRQIKDIDKATPDRPSVEETLNKNKNGETATLDEEDEYDDEEYPDDADTSTYELDGSSAADLAALNAAKEQAATEAEAAEKKANNAAENVNTRPASYDSADSNGKYLVVAGTFKQEINAQSQLKKFKQMGYNNAEVGKFNKNAYASLVVERFATSAQAQKLVKSLKAKGIDCYVHKKR